MTQRVFVVVLVVCGFMMSGRAASAEPMFLSKGETRCTTCHYSPTGGGLLTPYGRLQSRQELSTTDGDSEQFLWGAFGDALGPVDLGIDARPTHLRVSFPGGTSSRYLLMNADVLAAVQGGGWTFYGQVGRRPEVVGGDIYSYEYWGGKQLTSEWAVRGGRFFPAYGIRFADHTSFNRVTLGFDKYDQVFGAEISHTTQNRLIQISAGPGRAESVLNEPGKNPFTTTGRVQFDLNRRNVLVGSGMFRSESAREVSNGAAGVAYGFSPASRVTVWTEVDARFRDETDGESVVFVNETSVEAIRGVWLKFSPQVRTEAGAVPGFVRYKLEANILPRTHWNVDIAYYRDQNRRNKFVTHTLMSQLHLYL
ncbi:MAG: hypothetical protein EHM55_17380 [Acidobacteria bacterium]|nr:MAG: hypothetical protein EHM55_17380 [Acidobacteriota bacterium]